MPTNYSSGDYGGQDLILRDGDTLRGRIKNVGKLVIPQNTTVIALKNYDGLGAANRFPLRIWAEHIYIDGTLDASGEGFGGGGGAGGNYYGPDGTDAACGQFGKSKTTGGSGDYDWVRGDNGETGKVVNTTNGGTGARGGKGGSWLGDFPQEDGFYYPNPPTELNPDTGGTAPEPAKVLVSGEVENLNLDGGHGGYAAKGINGDATEDDSIHSGGGGAGGSSSVAPGGNIAGGGGGAGCAGGNGVGLYARKIVIGPTGKILSNDKLGGGAGGSAHQAAGGGGTSIQISEGTPTYTEEYAVALSNDKGVISALQTEVVSDYVMYSESNGVGLVIHRCSKVTLDSESITGPNDIFLSDFFASTNGYLNAIAYQQIPIGVTAMRMAQIAPDMTYVVGPTWTYGGQPIVQEWGFGRSFLFNRYWVGVRLPGSGEYRLFATTSNGGATTYLTKPLPLAPGDLPTYGTLAGWNGLNSSVFFASSGTTGSKLNMWEPSLDSFYSIPNPYSTFYVYPDRIQYGNNQDLWAIGSTASESVVMKIVPSSATTFSLVPFFTFNASSRNYVVDNIVPRGQYVLIVGHHRLDANDRKLFVHTSSPESELVFSYDIPLGMTIRDLDFSTNKLYATTQSGGNQIFNILEKTLVPGPTITGAAGGTYAGYQGGVGGILNEKGATAETYSGWVGGEGGEPPSGGLLAYQSSPTEYEDYVGGKGGRGAGGGILLKSIGVDVAGPQISIRGLIDNTGGLGETNGGTLKIFYTGSLDINYGTINTGRLFVKKLSKGITVM